MTNEVPTPPKVPVPQKESGWTFHLVSLFGIPIQIHFTFLVLIIWIALEGSSKEGERPYLRLLFVLAIFACVLLHELGHSLVARRHGIQTRNITLTPIGGVAVLETMPRPREELFIALAGPLVNIAIATLIYIGSLATHSPIKFPGTARPDTFPSFMSDLFTINIILAGFNLLPVFPMDGGRVFRSILAHFMDDVQATTIAVKVGQFLAALLGLYAFATGQWMLVVLAVFVYMAGGQEANAFQTKELASGHKVHEAMMREFHTLNTGDSLRVASDRLLAGSQHDFPVKSGNDIVGILTRSALLQGWAQEGGEAYVAEFMKRDFLIVPPDMALEEAILKVQGASNDPILVMEKGVSGESTLIGLLTQENLLEFLKLRQLQNMRSQRPDRR